MPRVLIEVYNPETEEADTLANDLPNIGVNTNKVWMYVGDNVRVSMDAATVHEMAAKLGSSAHRLPKTKRVEGR
jgi:hypothetical protein